MKYSSWNSVASYLVENIKKKIENGEYGEGSKLPSEKMLSEEYSVGRSSVREALKMLQAENLIEIVKGKGSFVLSTDARSKGIDQWYHSKKEVFRDLVEIRVALECLAVKKAAVKVTDDVIEKLISINQAYEATSATDITTRLEYDEAFHRLIVKTANMVLLEDIYNRFESAYTEYRIKGFVLTKYFKKAAEGHRQIIRAFQNRDEKSAEQLMYEHIYEVVDDIENKTCLTSDKKRGIITHEKETGKIIGAVIDNGNIVHLSKCASCCSCGEASREQNSGVFNQHCMQFNRVYNNWY